MTDNNTLIINYHLAKQEIENAINKAITEYKIPYSFLQTMIIGYEQQITQATNTEVRKAFLSTQNETKEKEREQDEEVLTEEKE